MVQWECESVLVCVCVCVTLFMVILPNEALSDESHTQSWILNKRSVRETQRQNGEAERQRTEETEVE